MIEVICVTYKQDWNLKCLINSFKSQTSSNWFLRIIHDGEGGNFSNLKQDLESNDYINNQVTLESTKKRFNDYGHSLRDYALKNPIRDSTWTIITNGDNYYLPTVIESIEFHEQKNPDAQFLFWNLIQRFEKKIFTQLEKDIYQQLDSKLQLGLIDMGAAAIKTSLARETGFNSREFEADFHYFRDCFKNLQKNYNIDSSKLVFKIPETLFVHI